MNESQNTPLTLRQRFSQLPGGLRRGLGVFFGLCAGVTLLDLFVHKHGDHGWNFFGFHSAYGFIACVLLVLIATWMRRPLLREENYYEDLEQTADD